MNAVRLLVVLWIAVFPAWGQDECPSPPDFITDLPPPPGSLEICDTTVGKVDGMSSYSGTASCTVQGVQYTGGDVAHKICLNSTGDLPNTVGFSLTSPDGDLALILVKEDGTCVANSPDFRGVSVAEAIPAASYEPGIYSLYVDSAVDARPGSYRLRVTGTNPGRVVKLRGSSDPSPAIAGSNLVQEFTVENAGSRPVTNLNLAVAVEELPPDVEPQPTIPPLDNGVWRVGTLEPGRRMTLRLPFTVNPSAMTGDIVKSMAKVMTADQPDFCGLTRADEETSITTQVERQVRLTLDVKTPMDDVIAGSGPVAPCPENLCHTVKVTNNGRSDASGLTLDVKLMIPPGVRLERVDAEPQDSFNRATGRWIVGVLRPGENEAKRVRLFFNVGSSARVNDKVVTTAKIVTVNEPTARPKRSGETTIQRQINLRITRAATPTRKVVAGRCDGVVSVPSDLIFQKAVHNNGPSDASNVELRLDVPEGLKGVTILPPALSTGTFVDGLWTIPVLPASDQAQLTSSLGIGPEADDESSITHTLTVVGAAESDRHGDKRRSQTVVVERQVELALELVAEPSGEAAVAGCPDVGVANPHCPDGPDPHFTVRLHNEGPSEAAAVRVVQMLTLPGGASLDEVPPEAGVTCADTESDDVVCSIVWEPVDRLLPSCDSEPPAGNSESLELGLTVGPSAPDMGKISYETVEINANAKVCVATDGNGSATTGEPCAANFPRDAIAISREVNFFLEHGFSSATVVAGSKKPEDQLTYGITIMNDGPSDTSRVAVELPPLELPDGVIADDPDVDRGGLDGNTWDIGALGRSEMATLTRELTVSPSTPAGSMIVEQGSPVVSAIENDRPPVESPPDQVSTVRVEAVTDLELEIAASRDPDLPDLPAIPDANLFYTLTLTNGGPSDSTGATVCTSLPRGLVFVGSPDDCQVDADLAVCGEDPVDLAECRDNEGSCILCNLSVDEDDEKSSKSLRFVAYLEPDFALPKVTGTARAVANETDEDGAEDTLEIDVVAAADLSLALSDEKDPVQRGVDDIHYKLEVANLGPGAASEVTIKHLLAPLERPCPRFCKSCDGEPECDQDDFEMIDCDEPECAPDACEIRFTVMNIAAGDSTKCNVFVREPIPGFVDVIEASASATGAQVDPDSGNNAADEVTTILVPAAVDLAVAQSADPDPAIIGRPLTYAMTVTHRGLPPMGGNDPMADNIVLLDALPQGVENPEILSCTPEDEGVFPCSLEEDGPCSPDEMGVDGCFQEDQEDQEEGVDRCIRFKIGALGVGESCCLNLQVDVPAVAGPLVNCAEVFMEGGNPNHARDPDFNNVSELETAIVFPLVVPYFEVGSGGAATTFAVRNATEGMIQARYQIFGSSEATFDLDLTERETRPILLGQGPPMGYVGIGLDPDTPQPDVPLDALSGDYFRLHPDVLVPPDDLTAEDRARSASGALLVDTDPERVPPGLCRRPRLGFVNGELGETDFVFFVPHSDDEPVGSGRVYSLDGRFVQELEIPSSKGDAFELNSREDFKILSSAGTVEWTFREGVVGHVVGIWRQGNAAVALPAFCPEPELPEDRPTPHLVLPFFEIGDGLTTLLGVHNATEEELRVRYEYFDAFGQRIRNDTGEPIVEKLPLKGRGSRLFYLTEVLGTANRAGFVHVTAIHPDGAIDPDDDQPVADALLHGEWLRRATGPDRELASGEALVDTRTTLRPPGFCRRWNARFYNDLGDVDDPDDDRTTTFIFYVEEDDPAPAEDDEGSELLVGEVYAQEGSPSRGRTRLTDSGARAFAKSVTELMLEGVEDGALGVKSGAIEWAFQGNRKGYIATIHRDGDLSVAVPAICRDGDPDR